VAVRDSKAGDPSFLLFTRAAWNAFCSGIALGDFSFTESS
jgi:hypothetical protein